MTAKNRIFLSYQRKSTPFALKLYQQLSNEGIQVWMDQYDIKIGDDWSMSLQTALDSCTAMIALISPSYVESQYCKIEMHRAATRVEPCPIYPLIVEQIEPEARPLEIQRIQHIDFSDAHDVELESYKTRIQEVFDVLKRRHVAQFGELPSVFKRYVHHLISDLQSYQGILEYVDLMGESLVASENSDYRPNPRKKLASGLEVIQNSLAPRNTITDAIDNFEDLKRTLSRFVLVGKPGAGKSTTLRYLALNSAIAYHQDPDRQLLPLFVRLGEWQRDVHPAEFIRMQWNRHQLPVNVDSTEFFKAGKGILYLDGLDEFGRDGQHKVHQLTEWLQSDQAPQNIIITCREDEYDSNTFSTLPTVALKPMQRQQIEVFSKNYLQQDAEPFLKRIFDTSARYGRNSLYNLAQNPYLLSALMIAFQTSPDEDLPKNPGALTQVLVKALWERENTRHPNGWIHYYDLEAAFSKLAFAIIDQQKPNDVQRSFAIEQLGSYSLVEAGQRTNIFVVDGDYVRFYHEMIQDYFAGLKLKQMGFKQRFSAPTFTQSYRISDKWEQAVLALSGIVNKPDVVIEDIMQIDPYWATTCINSGVNVSEATIDRLVHRLVMEFDIDVSLQQYARGLLELNDLYRVKQDLTQEALINLGGLVVKPLCDVLLSNNYDALVKQPVAEVLVNIATTDVYHLIEQVAQDADAELQAIERALAKTKSLSRRDSALDLGMKTVNLVFGKSRKIKNSEPLTDRSYPTSAEELQYRTTCEKILTKLKHA